MSQVTALTTTTVITTPFGWSHFSGQIRPSVTKIFGLSLGFDRTGTSCGMKFSPEKSRRGDSWTACATPIIVFAIGSFLGSGFSIDHDFALPDHSGAIRASVLHPINSSEPQSSGGAVVRGRLSAAQPRQKFYWGEERSTHLS